MVWNVVAGDCCLCYLWNLIPGLLSIDLLVGWLILKLLLLLLLVDWWLLQLQAICRKISVVQFSEMSDAEANTITYLYYALSSRWARTLEFAKLN